MRIALVDNGTKNMNRLLSLLEGHAIDVFEWNKLKELSPGYYDFIVLSGSSLFPIAYNLEKLEPELELIRKSNTPILGICYGAELITVAFGGTLRDTGKKEKGIYTVSVTEGDTIFSNTKDFSVYDAHRWVIDTIPNELEVLAHSELGPEIIRHRTRPIYGFQFHPEKMTEETFGDELFRALIATLSPSSTAGPS